MLSDDDDHFHYIIKHFIIFSMGNDTTNACDSVVMDVGRSAKDFVKVDGQSLLGQPVTTMLDFECLFLSHRAVCTRVVLVSSLPFHELQAASKPQLVGFLKSHTIAYYYFQSTSLVAIKHVRSLVCTPDLAVCEIGNTNRNRFMLVFSEKSTANVLSRVRHFPKTIYLDNHNSDFLLQASHRIGKDLNILKCTSLEDVVKLATEPPCLYEVIVTRLDMGEYQEDTFIRRMMSSVKSVNPTIASFGADPVVVCYARVPRTIPGCNVVLPYSYDVDLDVKNLLSAYVLSINRLALEGALNASSF